MLPLVKIGSIAAFVAIAAVGLTIVIVYVAAPISFKDVCEDVTPPSTFSLVPISDSMFLTWGRGTASSNCEINYELLVYNNDEHIYNITLFSNQYLYPMADKPSCSIYAFELITISNGQYRTESLKRSYETDLETVSNLNVEEDLVSWSINNINTNCVFQLDINRVTVANNLSSLSYDIDELSFCESHIITVTPINFNGTIGTPSTLYFERDISYPKDITMEQESENNTILIAWNHTRYELCEVGYLLNGETYEVSELTPGRQNIDISALKYCSRHVLGVIFSSLSNEVENSINFTKRLVFPSDLKHNIDSNLEEVILSWNHTLYKSCLVEINLDNNSVSIEDPFTGSQSIPISELEFCRIHVLEMVFLDESNGAGVSTEESFDIARGVVFPSDFKHNIDSNLEEVILSWNHTLYKSCLVEINLDNNSVSIEDPFTGSQSIPISELEFCRIHVLEMVFLDESNGAGVSAEESFDIARGVVFPSDFKHNIDSNLEEVILSWNHTLYKSCLVEINLDNNSVSIEDPFTGSQSIPISELEFCRIHVLEMVFLDESNGAGVSAEESFDIARGVVFPSDFKHNIDSNLEEVILSWNHTLYKSCLVEINLDNNSVSIEDPFTGSQSIPISELEFCRIHVLEMVFLDESNGAGVSTEESFDIARGVVFPSDFKHNIDSNLEEVILSWNHTLYKSCLVEINLDNNSVSIEDPFTGSQSIPISELEFCRIHVLEMVFLDESNGTAVSAEESFDIARGVVFPSDLKHNIDSNLEEVILSWNHTLYKSCLVEINLDNNSVSIEDPFTGSQSIPISELEFCRIHVLEMVFLDESNGAAVSAEESFDIARGIVFPSDLEYNIDTNLEVVVLSWNHTLYKSCLVEINLDSNSVSVDDPFTGSQSIPISELEFCSIYVLEVVFIDESNGIDSQKQDYNFTRPGIFPDNLDLTVTSTTAQFVWDNTGLEDCIYNITSENFAINTDSPVIEGLNGECDIYDVNIILKDQLGKITDEKSFKFSPFQSIKDLTGVLTQTPLDNDPTSNIVEISMTVKDCKLLSDIAYNCTTYNSPITTSRSHLFDNCLIDISDNFWMSIKPILFDSGDEDIKVNEVKCSYEWNNASGSLDVILEESDEDICPPTIKKSDLTDE